MPYKDKAIRDVKQKEWRQKSYTPAYLKWLYARRKLHVEKATLYEDALRHIAKNDFKMATGDYAAEIIIRATEMTMSVGNRFDHELDKPYFKED